MKLIDVVLGNDNMDETLAAIGSAEIDVDAAWEFMTGEFQRWCDSVRVPYVNVGSTIKFSTEGRVECERLIHKLLERFDVSLFYYRWTLGGIYVFKKNAKPMVLRLYRNQRAAA